jgi:hypothetical protein
MGCRYRAVDFIALTKNAKTYHKQPPDVTAHAEHPCYIQNHTVFCYHHHHVGINPTLNCSALKLHSSVHVSIFHFMLEWLIGNKFPFWNNYRATCIITEFFLATVFNAVLYKSCLAYLTKCVHCLTASSSQNHEPWFQQIIKNQAVVEPNKSW